MKEKQYNLCEMYLGLASCALCLLWRKDFQPRKPYCLLSWLQESDVQLLGQVGILYIISVTDLEGQELLNTTLVSKVL